MTTWLFPPAPTPAVPVIGTDALYPVCRIFCVARNYADHAAEMGAEVDRAAPFYFTKSATALVNSGATIPYPLATNDWQHEVELVVALGPDGVLGYAVGLDLTRRDLQAEAKAKGRPWDSAKDFAHSAVIGPITPAGGWSPAGQAITLSVNDAPRQSGRLSAMVWPVPALLIHLGGLYDLGAGDLVMTGTPAGVGPLRPGDRVAAQIDGLAPVSLTVQPSE